jgi:hypothetical protein
VDADDARKLHAIRNALAGVVANVDFVEEILREEWFPQPPGLDAKKPIHADVMRALMHVRQAAHELAALAGETKKPR